MSLHFLLVHNNVNQFPNQATKLSIIFFIPYYCSTSRGITQAFKSIIQFYAGKCIEMNEDKQKIGSISKNKNVCFIIKDNKINQKIQINTKEIIKHNHSFFSEMENVPE